MIILTLILDALFDSCSLRDGNVVQPDAGLTTWAWLATCVLQR